MIMGKYVLFLVFEIRCLFWGLCMWMYMSAKPNVHFGEYAHGSTRYELSLERTF